MNECRINQVRLSMISNATLCFIWRSLFYLYFYAKVGQKLGQGYGAPSATKINRN